jgi:hypothetical protein
VELWRVQCGGVLIFTRTPRRPRIPCPYTLQLLRLCSSALCKAKKATIIVLSKTRDKDKEEEDKDKDK